MPITKNYLETENFTERRLSSRNGSVAANAGATSIDAKPVPINSQLIVSGIVRASAGQVGPPIPITGNTGTQLTSTAHGLSSGVPVLLTATTQPGALVGTTVYFAGVIDANTISLYDTEAHAISAGATGRQSTGTQQVTTATVTAASGVTGNGNVNVIVTAAGMHNSPKTVAVAMTTASNSQTAVNTALVAALAADPDVSAFFAMTGTTTIIATARQAAANDATMNIAVAETTATGLTAAPTSVATTAGVTGGVAVVVNPTVVNALFKVFAGVSNKNGVTALIGTPSITSLTETDPAVGPWAITVTADNTLDNLVINLTPDIGLATRWQTLLEVYRTDLDVVVGAFSG